MQLAERVLTKARKRLEEEQAGKLRKVEVLTRCRGALERIPEPFAGDEADKAVVSIEEQLGHLELCQISSCCCCASDCCPKRLGAGHPG